MEENVKLEDLKFPRELIFQVKWGVNKYKDYRKMINDMRHCENTQNFYEKRGGKCIGVLDVETILKKEKEKNGK